MTTTYETRSEAQAVLRRWIAQGKAQNKQRRGIVADSVCDESGYKIHGQEGTLSFCVNAEDVK